ncbi:MAG: methyltransferase domain-containing protein [Acetobacteraceae bacterium]|nr:methyltransferase domain-containing protein [Acetobacteraceae bacterium]
MRLFRPRERRAADEGDIRASFASLGEWTDFLSRHPALERPERIARIVGEACARGISSTFLGAVSPRDIALRGANYREDLLAAGLNPRQRAILDLLSEDPRAADAHALRLFAHEAVTPLALALRGRFTRLLCSEYASDADAAARARLFPIPVIDIMQSGLPDAAFDVIASNDVFEHVADLDAALHDTARILRPGGRLLASFPFLFGREASELRAVSERGVVRHLMPPEYHGNPADPERDSLVFRIMGWDVLPRIRDAGFADARMVFWSSVARGLTGAEIAGVFTLDARR